jgi:ABC-type polysaccharide/polyol phosphate export permease
LEQDLKIKRKKPEHNFFLIIDDLIAGLLMYQLWGRLGWKDILNRYQRSLLGPIWLTISMGVLIGALGLLYANLFKMDLSTYLPFLTVGFIIWQLISGILLDGCNAFVNAEGIIKQIKLPLSLHVYRLLWKNLITLAHNSVVIIFVMFFFKVEVGFQTLLLLLGILSLFLNGLWCALVLGLLCARYRDLNPTIGSLVQLSFFVTPIIWDPSLLPDRQFILLYNPFYHFIESIRGPILGTTVGVETWLILAGITMFGWLVVIPLASRMQRKLVYWL